MYILLDGNMQGNVSVLCNAFSCKCDSCHCYSFPVWELLARSEERDEYLPRVGEFGAASAGPAESMLVVSSELLTPPASYHEKGFEVNSTPSEHRWRASRAEKMAILGSEVDHALGHARGKKVKMQDEPVFWVSTSPAFWTEILTAFNIVGVIDLSAGEGTCALACYRKALPYVGITFNEQHSVRLLMHLERVILGCMTEEDDPLYDATFADAVGSSASMPSAAGKAKARRTLKRHNSKVVAPPPADQADIDSDIDH